jgi:hypothetical protein
VGPDLSLPVPSIDFAAISSCRGGKG